MPRAQPAESNQDDSDSGELSRSVFPCCETTSVLTKSAAKLLPIKGKFISTSLTATTRERPPQLRSNANNFLSFLDLAFVKRILVAGHAIGGIQIEI